MVSPVGVEVKGLEARYGDEVALRGVDWAAQPGEISAVVGPARAGKSTLLKCLSRMSDHVPGLVVTGEVRLGGEDVFAMRDVAALRRRVGLVAPLPVGLPMSIRDNVTFAPRMAGVRDRAELERRAERCLRDAALWDEVKDRLDQLATRLSGGQQQRLAIARALSHEPDVLCLDEFSIAIDPITTARIEELLRGLRGKLTIVLVTNLVHQARRLASTTSMFWEGRVAESGPTEQLFTDARAQVTRDYLGGKVG